jgi:myosin heavy subunit
MSHQLKTNSQGSNHWRDALVWYALKDGGVWEPGKVLKYEETKTANEWKFVIETASKTLIEIVTPFSLDYQMVKRRDKDPLNAANITDMTSLSFLNEPEMLECMKQRFLKNLIYTNTGPILFAVNPFQRLPVYTDELLNAFEEADQTASRQLGPHVYQISSRAFNKMFIDKFDSAKRENQSVLVNGESGAGKNLCEDSKIKS